MDSITQAALGASIGQAGFAKLGRRAIVFGAACGTLPDLDIVFGRSDPWTSLVTHRGLSHSLLVLPLVALPLGWLAWRLLGKRGSPKDWMHLAFWALITHPLLDFLTTYGTQLFLPLTNHRYALDTIGIIDPIYSLPLFVAVGYGLRKKPAPELRARHARRALTFTTAYLVFHMLWSGWAHTGFQERLAGLGFEAVATRAPAPALFPMLRHGVARDAHGRIAVATIAPWDQDGYPIYIVDSSGTPRIRAALESERGQLLLWFSDGYLSVREQGDGSLLFEDHRYGRFTDPRLSFFRSTLASEDRPDEIVLRRPREATEQLDLGAELRAGWGILSGEYPEEEEAHPARD